MVRSVRTSSEVGDGAGARRSGRGALRRGCIAIAGLVLAVACGDGGARGRESADPIGTWEEDRVRLRSSNCGAAGDAVLTELLAFLGGRRDIEPAESGVAVEIADSDVAFRGELHDATLEASTLLREIDEPCRIDVVVGLVVRVGRSPSTARYVVDGSFRSCPGLSNCRQTWASRWQSVAPDAVGSPLGSRATQAGDT